MDSDDDDYSYSSSTLVEGGTTLSELQTSTTDMTCTTPQPHLSPITRVMHVFSVAQLSTLNLGDTLDDPRQVMDQTARHKREQAQLHDQEERRRKTHLYVPPPVPTRMLFECNWCHQQGNTPITRVVGCVCVCVMCIFSGQGGGAQVSQLCGSLLLQQPIVPRSRPV
jgi:hypothetical protein